MCGIAGIIEPKVENKDAIIREMVSRIFHRGPDEDGFFVDENVALGMRRLSIIDLSTGKQPIWSADGKKCIFFNGEIYNYKELKEGLEARGKKFSTNSDTEVVLQMFDESGEKMLPLLRGMFAFCIYDIETKTIFLARDFFGIKPLYYLKDTGPDTADGQGKILAFASEIKSFLPFPGFKPEVNDGAVYNYLSYQYNPLPETFFKSVYKLPPAHYMRINVINGDMEMKKYWSFEFSPRGTLGEGERQTTQEIYDTVHDSVAHHMIADVPVGSFLSGGVDSSIIATMMQEIRGEKDVKTFTVGFDTLTEGKESKETSDFLGTDHIEIKIGPEEYFKVLPKAVWHFDEPVADPSAIGLYFVAREARKHVTVVLSGEGADELFGGYNIYLAPLAYKKISWIPKTVLELILKLPFEFRGKNFVRRAYNKIENWYIGNASVFKNDELSSLWIGKTQNSFSLFSIYEQAKNLSDSAKMQYVDINTWLVGDILAKADKMTMANSLELRVPFLDIEVAKLAETLPDKFKWKNGTRLFGGQVTKYLLREAFKNVIPETTRNRKKLGFPTPICDWLTADKRDIYDTILENPYILEHMNTVYIEKLITEHVKKREDNSRKIYLLLMLALWYDVFMRENNF